MRLRRQTLALRRPTPVRMTARQPSPAAVHTGSLHQVARPRLEPVRRRAPPALRLQAKARKAVIIERPNKVQPRRPHLSHLVMRRLPLLRAHTRRVAVTPLAEAPARPAPRQRAVLATNN